MRSRNAEQRSARISPIRNGAWLTAEPGHLEAERVKRRIYEILEGAEVGDTFSLAFDLFIITVIILDVLALIVGVAPRWAKDPVAHRRPAGAE